MVSELSSENVEGVLSDCLYTDAELKESGGETPEGTIIVEGIHRSFGLHPGRVQTHEDEIARMLDELPDTFKESGGGGWSFLNACNDKHDRQWTSFHKTMDALFVLGMAIRKVKCLMPREVWSLMPGGMPYYIILNKPEPV